ncbi:thioesterase II family protein [Nocardioides bruguierae]|uniref:Alpha/beta fold hydrolase n=1 Tax=Nocardioides bruguierae TaxID=2945102 RepID=A0A9X2IGR1_9ACTN|nr:alpha/beta fold hydrolase [Nocardioides bruguierae]MCM0622627.1 alpha/beta fold hydrolase [Nocardioides bruguierae]
MTVGFLESGRGPATQARLYAFPHAGGMAHEFRDWAALVPGIDVCALQLPGRPPYMGSDPIEDVRAIAKAAAAEIRVDLPFGLIGHSFGALVAYETLRVLQSEYGCVGEAQFAWGSPTLWASAFPAPHRIPEAPAIAALSDQRLLSFLAERFDAVPREVLSDPELMTIVVGYLRSDYTALERYRFEPGPRLNADIQVLLGSEDDLDPSASSSWADLTTRDCDVAVMPGDHFYIREPDARAQIADRVTSALIGKA